MMTSRILLVTGLLALTGCPLGPTDSGPDAGSLPSVQSINAIAGSAAEEGGDALNALVQQAAEDRFPPAPSLDTLCQLEAGHTDYNAAKKILGPPQGESQDAMMAGLSYRFRPLASAAAGGAGGAAGHAGAGGAGGSDDDANPITLYLEFAWSDGSPGIGTVIFGIGGSPEDFLRGYILDKMSISGMPYPDCWPHDEP